MFHKKSFSNLRLLENLQVGNKSRYGGKIRQSKGTFKTPATSENIRVNENNSSKSNNNNNNFCQPLANLVNYEIVSWKKGNEIFKKEKKLIILEFNKRKEKCDFENLQRGNVQWHVELRYPAYFR